MVCQMCGNSSKTKSEIMKHYQKDHIIFFIQNRRSWDFKPLLEKAKPTSVDSSSDKPKALIRNVASQPNQGQFGSMVGQFETICTIYTPPSVKSSQLTFMFKTHIVRYFQT